MKTAGIICLSLLGVAAAVNAPAQTSVSPLPPPEVTTDSWVMIEIWPDLRDITLAAYFLDYSYDKNKNLCEATKRAFDRDQAQLEEEQGREFTSYRLCLSVPKAEAEGYIESTKLSLRRSPGTNGS